MADTPPVHPTGTSATTTPAKPIVPDPPKAAVVEPPKPTEPVKPAKKTTEETFKTGKHVRFPTNQNASILGGVGEVVHTENEVVTVKSFNGTREQNHNYPPTVLTVVD